MASYVSVRESYAYVYISCNKQIYLRHIRNVAESTASSFKDDLVQAHCCVGVNEGAVIE